MHTRFASLAFYHGNPERGLKTAAAGIFVSNYKIGIVRDCHKKMTVTNALCMLSRASNRLQCFTSIFERIFILEDIYASWRKRHEFDYFLLCEQKLDRPQINRQKIWPSSLLAHIWIILPFVNLFVSVASASQTPEEKTEGNFDIYLIAFTCFLNIHKAIQDALLQLLLVHCAYKITWLYSKSIFSFSRW